MFTDAEVVFLKRSVRVDGLKLRRLRNTVGLTQEMAAQKSGYSDRLIRKLERGGPVALSTLQDILHCYREAGDQAEHDCRDFVVTNSESPETRIRQWLFMVFDPDEQHDLRILLDPHVRWRVDGETFIGATEIAERFRNLRSALKPVELTMDQVIENETSAVAYWTLQAIHVGRFLNFPPTKRPIFIQGSLLITIANNRIAEAREQWDTQDILAQLNL